MFYSAHILDEQLNQFNLNCQHLFHLVHYAIQNSVLLCIYLTVAYKLFILLSSLFYFF